MKKALRRKGDLGIADNVKRNDYNNLIREEYGEGGSLFDIALIQSTLPDGSRSQFKLSGKKYDSLWDGYSRDGGHLLEIGQRKIAGELLAFLAKSAVPVSR